MKVAPFHLIGGIHPPEFKTLSNQTAIEVAPIAPRLSIALQQNLGAAPILCVKVGERVLANQIIATSQGVLSVALHAPAAGLIESIGQSPCLHPSRLPETILVLKTDTIQDEVVPVPLDNWHNLPKSEVLAFLQQMGIVGLGGAMFPSHIKADSTAVKRLILNGAECEPFITCDDRLMREYAAEILAGARILAYLLDVSEVLIGVEDNKAEAIKQLIEEAAKERNLLIEVFTLPTKYPSGSLKQLIYLLTGEKLPSGALPSSIGMQVFNVGTVFAIFEAIEKGLPLTHRVVTLTGDVAKPKNVWALIGTPIEFLMREAKISPRAKSVIVGGPMMGEEIVDFSIGINKGSNALIAKSPALFRQPQTSAPCIRCGQCALACPQQLQPMDLVWLSKSRDFEQVKNYAVFNCIECGACDFVCPSHIKLVDYIKHAKSQVQKNAREGSAARRAQMRNEFRLFRLDRDKQEKAERLTRINTQAKEDLAAKAKVSSINDNSNTLNSAKQVVVKKVAQAMQNTHQSPPVAEDLMAKYKDQD